VTEIIFAVLFVSLMGLTRCYKTTVFLHLYKVIHLVLTIEETGKEATRLRSCFRLRLLPVNDLETFPSELEEFS